MRVPRNIALEVFGLKENFSKEELKREYKRLVKIVHPDTGGDENLFKFIENCKNILINGEKVQETNNHESNSCKNNTESEKEFSIDLEKLETYYPYGMEKLKKYNITEIEIFLSIYIRPLFKKSLERHLVVRRGIPYSKFNSITGVLKFAQTIKIPKEMQKFKIFKVRVEFLDDTYKFKVSNGSFKVIGHRKWAYAECLEAFCVLHFKK